jgi:acetyl esterase
MTQRVSAALAALVMTVIALITVGTSVPAVAQSEPSPAVTEQQNIAYATIDGEPILLDALLPNTSARRRPAIVLIHAGGWAIGDKVSFVDDARLLSQLGFVVFSVNYRLAPLHPYPAAVDDVRTAIRWLRLPTQVANFRIDPKKIGAFGASSGAHLAGLLATLGHGSLSRGSRINAAISWSGPMDFTLESDTYTAVVGTTNVSDFLGCTPADPGCAATEAAASPITYVDKSDAPMLLANSEAELVPVDQATRMADALTAAGVQHQLIVLPGIRHAGAYQPDVWDATVAFLDRYLGQPVAPIAPAAPAG